MILLLIISSVLIWMQFSSLRFIIAAGNNKSMIEDAKKVEKLMPNSKKIFSLKSAPVILSLGLILVLNLIEIGYFIFCVYIFNDSVITIGGAILVGYAIYTLIKFFPKIKKFFVKPIDYLVEKTEGMDRLLSLIMSSLEIAFCAYVFFKTIIKYDIF